MGLWAKEAVHSELCITLSYRPVKHILQVSLPDVCSITIGWGAKVEKTSLYLPNWEVIEGATATWSHLTTFARASANTSNIGTISLACLKRVIMVLTRSQYKEQVIPAFSHHLAADDAWVRRSLPGSSLSTWKSDARAQPSSADVFAHNFGKCLTRPCRSGSLGSCCAALTWSFLARECRCTSPLPNSQLCLSSTPHCCKLNSHMSAKGHNRALLRLRACYCNRCLSLLSIQGLNRTLANLHCSSQASLPPVIVVQAGLSQAEVAAAPSPAC